MCGRHGDQPRMVTSFNQPLSPRWRHLAPAPWQRRPLVSASGTRVGTSPGRQPTGVLRNGGGHCHHLAPRRMPTVTRQHRWANHTGSPATPAFHRHDSGLLWMVEPVPQRLVPRLDRITRSRLGVQAARPYPTVPRPR